MNRLLLVLSLLLWATPGWARPNYDRVDAHALAAPRSVENSVETLAVYLSRGAHSPEEKARVIYRWITDRIAYDAAAFFSGHPPQDYASALSTRKAVCAGYTELFLVLAKRMGLQAERVTGMSKGYGFEADGASLKSQNHAWVAVKFGGHWHLVDPTWGAGALSRDGHFTKKFSDYWFLTPPRQMIYDHFPTQSNWQLLSPPWNSETFRAAMRVTHYFFDYGLEPLSHRHFDVTCQGEQHLRFRGPGNLLLVASLLSEKQTALSKDEIWTLVSHQGRESSIRVRCPQPGTYKLRIYGRLFDGVFRQKANYDWMAEYRVECGRSGQAFPRAFGAYVENNARLVRPTQGKLRAGRPADFEISVPRAQEVKLVWTGGEQLLAGSGGHFRGRCSPPAGTLSVFARFPGETRGLGLLEYEIR